MQGWLDIRKPIIAIHCITILKGGKHMSVSIEKEKAFENIQYELLKAGWWRKDLSANQE